MNTIGLAVSLATIEEAHELEVGDLVKVTWLDAWYHPEADYERNKPLIVYSVGWVIAICDEGIKVSPDSTDEGEYRGVHFIPDDYIEEVVLLSENIRCFWG